jgi:cell division septum initiation protein DivIVA
VTAEHSSPAPGAVTPERQAILDDIEETREQLGQTVEALAAKADVKAQVQDKAAAAAGAARQQAQRVAAAAGSRSQELTVAAAGLGAALVTWILTRRLRRG